MFYYNMSANFMLFAFLPKITEYHFILTKCWLCIRNLYFRIYAFRKTYLVAICFTCAIIRSSRKSYGNVFVHVFNSRTIFSSESCSGHKFNKPPNISCGLMYKRDDRRNENTKSLKWKMWKMKKYKRWCFCISKILLYHSLRTFLAPKDW